MQLIKPSFVLDSTNPGPGTIPDAIWWLWLKLRALEHSSRNGGILAWKKGFHSSGEYNLENYPLNYSIRDAVNTAGPWWRKYASAFDWTFPDAQRGNYHTINKYTSRLVRSSLDKSDPRLDLILFEFYGQADEDRAVEGRNTYRDENVASDQSHLWHIHFSFLRSKCGDFEGMWALLTVLMGASTIDWRVSNGEQPSPPSPRPVVRHFPGTRVLKVGQPSMTGEDAEYAQKWIGPRCGPADRIYGPRTADGVRWYQRMRGIEIDGEVGPVTWRHMGVTWVG